MISLDEIRSNSKRSNFEKNIRLNFFSARLAPYCTWVFANMGLKPNHVTLLFFLAGVTAAMLVLSNKGAYVILSYLLYRAHLVLDVSDGELARYQKRFSRNGAYWDYLTHSLVYPLFFANMGIALYLRYGMMEFLFMASFGAISIGFFDAAKNDYYRALFANRVTLDEYSSSDSEASSGKSIFKRTHPVFFEVFSFEGLITLYVISFFFWGAAISKLILSSYTLLFFIMSALKIILLSREGTYPKRN